MNYSMHVVSVVDEWSKYFGMFVHIYIIQNSHVFKEFQIDCPTETTKEDVIALEEFFEELKREGIEMEQLIKTIYCIQRFIRIFGTVFAAIYTAEELKPWQKQK